MLLNTKDYRLAARRRLPRGLFEYIDRGTEDETALSDLRQSFDRYRIAPAVLTGHSSPDWSVQAMGQRFDMPVIVAPTALAGMVSDRGEQKLSRAAKRAGMRFSASTQSVESLEDIVAGSDPAHLWLQLYYWKNRDLTWDFLKRAWAMGVRTLVVTADTPVGPNREYNLRNGFGIPFKIGPKVALDIACHPQWLWTVILPSLRRGYLPTYGNYPPEFRSSVTRAVVARDVQLETNLTWADMRDLRDRWQGDIILKGVMTVADAVQAQALGMQGIVVSSHGARNIDIIPSPLKMIGAIRAAVGDQLMVLADSGILRGTDVLKYLHAGADAVMVGRLPLWGLAAGGEAGADAILAMLRREMDIAMSMLGVNTPKALRELAHIPG